MLRRMRRGHGGERHAQGGRAAARRRCRSSSSGPRSSSATRARPTRTSTSCSSSSAGPSSIASACSATRRRRARRAARWTPRCRPKVAAARHRKLMSAQRPISRKKLKRHGRPRDRGPGRGRRASESEFLLEGRWWGQAPEIDGKVYPGQRRSTPGEIRKALVTDAADYDLVADLYDADGNLAEPPPGAPKRRVRLPTVGR